MTEPSPPRAFHRRRGTIVAVRIAFAVLFAVVSVAVPACSGSVRENYDYLRVTVDGEPTLGISKKNVSLRGVVIFFHGVDGDEFATTDKAHTALTETLVSAGFAIVSSRAGGNEFGNPATQNNYRALGDMALQQYHVENVFFLAESLGTIAALNLLAQVDTPRIRGLAAVTPALDSALAPKQYTPMIDSNDPNQSADVVDPMKLPVGSLRGKRIRLYSDSHGQADASAFRARFGGVADISVEQCPARHGDDTSCVQPDNILKWFTELERRAAS